MDSSDDTTARPDPSESELEQVAEPATLRRAPKFSAFIVMGAVAGAVLGLVLALLAGPDSPIVADGTGFISFLDGQGTARLLSALIGAVVGAMLGAGLAAWADRRSLRDGTRVRP